MRHIFFRLAAVFLGGASLWALLAGGVKNVGLLECVSLFGMTVVFLLYGFVGERPAYFVLKLMGCLSSEKQSGDAVVDPSPPHEN
jgi:hypothetical protein